MSEKEHLPRLSEAGSSALLPVETLLFESDSVRIGRFRCAPDHPLFLDSGPIFRHVLVFPRTTVKIQHAGEDAFVASPNVATLYNRGQHYRRYSVGGAPDHCEWFALAPDVLMEVLRAAEPQRDHDPDRPFRRASAATSARLYYRQRILVTALMRGTADPLQVEEEALSIAAGLCGGARTVSSRTRSGRERVERAKEFIGERVSESLSLRTIAREVQTSPYHLCRIFRRQTGFSIHAYTQQLRLRLALGSVLASDDILTVATDLNFASHSHFTTRFRSAFGVLPSAYRESQRSAIR